MPLINGQYVDYDPDKLADAIGAGHSVEADRYDYEDQTQFQQRAQRESSQISEILKKKDPKAWRRWRGIPELENTAPYNEWEKIPDHEVIARADITPGFALDYIKQFRQGA